LHYAAFIGDVRAVEKLIDRGADIHVVDELRNPLFSAASCSEPGAVKICDILLPIGVKLHENDEKKNRTVLHHAARCSTPETVERLVQAGVNLSAIDVNGQNACHRAVERGHVPADIIRTLVMAGCSVMVRDRSGRTPLETLGIIRA
jgi:ankyrin repeat protein